jgi:hypothetical protein
MVYGSEQSVGQLIPAGLLVTVPPPFPDIVTESPKLLRVNVAVTDFAASRVTVQFPVPVHPPDQPVKFEFTSAVAVRVTTVFMV